MYYGICASSELEILNTPSNKASVLYSCLVRLFKSTRHFISHAFAELMNMSI